MMNGSKRSWAGALCVVLCLGMIVHAQSLGELDFSQTRVSIAGPDRFYVRNVLLDSVAMSGTVELDSDGRWHIIEFFPSDRDRWDDNIILDFVEISTDGVDTIDIDGIILGNQVYRGRLRVDEAARIDFDESLEEGNIPPRAVDAAAAFADLLTEGERRAFQRRIGELEEELRHAVQDRDVLLSILDGEPDDAMLAREARRLDERIRGLQDEVQDVTASRDALSERLTMVEQERDQLIVELALVEQTVTRLEEEIVILQSEITRLSRTDDPSRQLTAEAFHREAEELRSFLAEADSRIQRLEEQARTVETRDEANLRSRALEARLRSELTLLRSELAATRNQRDLLEQNTLLSLLDDGIVAGVASLPGHTLQRGFTGGVPQLGTWFVSDSLLEQTSEREFFAKYIIPVQQGGETTLYRFSVETGPRGWVGAGLHFSASNSYLSGYGFGESLLVWFTRDPAHYQNDRTYVQLYRSDDDVRMERVLDAQIEQHIADGLQVDVLYEPARGYVTVAVNGIDTVRYRTWFDIDAGFEVALRSLGDGARFRDLEIIEIEADRR